jgi:hypothetical protein
MRRMLIYITIGTIVSINSIYSKNLPEYTYLSHNSSTTFNIVSTNLRSKQQLLYNKLDKHINYLSKYLYSHCINNMTSMNRSMKNTPIIQNQVISCIKLHLNSITYDQNPKSFGQMMEKLKIKKEDWNYANLLYTSIVYNKYP